MRVRLPWRKPDNEARAISYQDVFGTGGEWPQRTSSAGEKVTETSALGLSAVWASVNLLAGIVSSLPIDVLTGVGPNARPVDPAPTLVREPSLKVTRREWVYQAMVSLLIHGNAYGYVLGRDNLLRPTAVEWLHPSSMRVEEDGALSLPRYYVGGEKVDTEDVWHLRAFPSPGSAIGMAPLDMHRETFGLGLAARRYGADFFASGAHPSALLYTDQPVPQDTADTLKVRFKAAVKGREPLVAGAGLKYQQMQTAPNESQFLETRDQIAVEVARSFGIPPEMIGVAAAGKGSITYANREQRSADFLTYSVNQWLVKFEDALTAALPRPQYAKFNTGALLMSDLSTRYASYSVALAGMPFLDVDEVRALENKPPMPKPDPVVATPPTAGD